MFVVKTSLSSLFAQVSVFSSSNMSLIDAYMNFPKLSIVCYLYLVFTNKSHYIFHGSL